MVEKPYYFWSSLTPEALKVKPIMCYLDYAYNFHLALILTLHLKEMMIKKTKKKHVPILSIIFIQIILAAAVWPLTTRGRRPSHGYGGSSPSPRNVTGCVTQVTIRRGWSRAPPLREILSSARFEARLRATNDRGDCIWRAHRILAAHAWLLSD